MVSKILKFGKQKGSSMMLRANGQGGSSATVLAAHFAKQHTIWLPIQNFIRSLLPVFIEISR